MPDSNVTIKLRGTEVVVTSAFATESDAEGFFEMLRQAVRDDPTRLRIDIAMGQPQIELQPWIGFPPSNPAGNHQNEDDQQHQPETAAPRPGAAVAPASPPADAAERAHDQKNKQHKNKQRHGKPRKSAKGKRARR